jgi:hypothetical protein
MWVQFENKKTINQGFFDFLKWLLDVRWAWIVLIIDAVVFWLLCISGKGQTLYAIPLQSLDRVAQVLVTVLLITVTIIVFGLPHWSQGEEIIGRGQLG